MYNHYLLLSSKKVHSNLQKLCQLCQKKKKKKKKHNLKVENYALFGQFSENFKSLRDCFKELREEPEYINTKSFAKTRWSEHQNIIVN